MQVTANLSSATAFVGQLKTAMAAIEKEVSDTCRASVNLLMDDVIALHPIDEDMEDNRISRGDWQAQAGSDPQGDVNRSDESGNLAREAIADAADSWDPLSGETLYIANNVEYTPMLEYGLYPKNSNPPSHKTTNGFSNQAPQGMVGVNAERLQHYVDKAKNVVASSAKEI